MGRVPRVVRRLFLCGVVAHAATSAGGCQELAPLGSLPADERRLSERENLAHLARALGEDMTVADLFRRGDALSFARAPDPTELLERTAALDDDRPQRDGAELSLLVQNVALLDAKLFGVIDYARTPLLEARRAVLPRLYLESGFDVLMLQEVWALEDVARFVEAAEAAGYQAFPGMRDAYNDGLLLLVRADAIDAGAEPPSQGVVAYEAQDGLEYFPGPAIKRGYQWVRFTHPSAGPIWLYNTHMQAYAKNWQHRMRQARQLGAAIQEQAADDELVFVGGDLNSGPYYAHATWTLPSGEQESHWWQNAIAYPLLLEYGGLVDLAVMGRPPEHAASDVTLGARVVNRPASSTAIAGGEAAYCGDTPHLAFTATDCNSLYFRQYAGTEFPARLDHLHARDPAGRLRVVRSELMFTEAQDFGGTQSEPSDHYGVRVVVNVANP